MTWASLVVAFTALACSRGQATSKQTAATAATAPGTAPSAAGTSANGYLERLTAFKTKLRRRGPAPQSFDPSERPPSGVREVTYESDGLTLKAWLAVPKTASAGAKVPGVAYFHGGFAFGAEDFEGARPFLDAGLAVLCPMLRGENGNPGDSEMYLGEVRDAKAAVRWLASQDMIDGAHIYTFGHSAGGIVSSLLSLHDAPIRHGGSAGSMYGPELFDWMAESVPFTLDDPQERALRLLLGNAQWMRHPHYAYMGDADPNQRAALARAEASASRGLLHTASVPGDHQACLEPAVAAYVKVIESSP
jgi:acetyl esterase/lipase